MLKTAEHVCRGDWSPAPADVALGLGGAERDRIGRDFAVRYVAIDREVVVPLCVIVQFVEFVAGQLEHELGERLPRRIDRNSRQESIPEIGIGVQLMEQRHRGQGRGILACQLAVSICWAVGRL